MSHVVAAATTESLDGQLTVREIADTVGGYNALGRALGISATAVWSWKRVPAERVLQVERITGLSRYCLRPDIYGPDPRGD